MPTITTALRQERSNRPGVLGYSHLDLFGGVGRDALSCPTSGVRSNSMGAVVSGVGGVADLSLLLGGQPPAAARLLLASCG